MINSDGTLQALDMSSNPCSTGACDATQTCCLSSGTKCGVVTTEVKQCASPTQAGICRVDGLTISTTYVVALAAVNDMGSSPYSSSVTITTNDFILPGPPQVNLLSASGGCLKLGLEPPAGSDSTSIQYYVVISGVTDGFQTAYNVSASTLVACDLNHDTTYLASAAVRSAHGVGESQLVNAATGALSGPTEVLGLLAGVTTSGYSTLSWTAPLDKGGMPIKQYDIAVTNQATNEVRYVVVSGSELTASISFLAASTSYSFSVHAVNNADLVGPDSSVIVSTGDAVVPQQPLHPSCFPLRVEHSTSLWSLQLTAVVRL